MIKENAHVLANSLLILLIIGSLISGKDLPKQSITIKVPENQIQQYCDKYSGFGYDLKQCSPYRTTIHDLQAGGYIIYDSYCTVDTYLLIFEK